MLKISLGILVFSRRY